MHNCALNILNIHFRVLASFLGYFVDCWSISLSIKVKKKKRSHKKWFWSSFSIQSKQFWHPAKQIFAALDHKELFYMYVFFTTVFHWCNYLSVSRTHFLYRFLFIFYMECDTMYNRGLINLSCLMSTECIYRFQTQIVMQKLCQII